jgi:hypothetical protein
MGRRANHEIIPILVGTHRQPDGLPLPLVHRHGKTEIDRKMLPLESEQKHVIVRGNMLLLLVMMTS